MLDYFRFEAVFPSEKQSTYDRTLQHEIEHHRKSLGGTLFIDRVMKSLGVSKGKSYPPKSDGALRQLHQQICEANMSTQHKQSLFYYMLLDFDAAGARGSVSQAFVSESGMPPNYQTFMKGLWYMDRQDYQQALEHVAHPSLNPDFADDIITTLARHAPGDLALSYFYAVRPILKSSSALEHLFDAMIRADATEALLFSRSHPEHTREQLFRQWMHTTLEDGHGQKSPIARGELTLMSFDNTEKRWFEEYLTTGEGKSLKRAKDTLLVRKIACDDFADIGKYRAGGQWAAVIEGVKKGIEGHGD